MIIFLQFLQTLIACVAEKIHVLRNNIDLLIKKFNGKSYRNIIDRINQFKNCKHVNNVELYIYTFINER